MFPRENFICAALAVRIKERVEPMLFKSSDPLFIGAAFVPRIKLCTIFPGCIHHFGQSTVATRKPCFQKGIFGVCETQLYIFIVQLAPEQCLFGSDLFRCIAGYPLEWCLRFWHKSADACVQFHCHTSYFSAL